ncbi:MAG: gliding motility-associated C-terminal domain-containing protein [Flavobacteriales bacterium]|nr:gliding motility-associated C-terminal domain-containing protein [Flavobacteriales bacterium]
MKRLIKYFFLFLIIHSTSLTYGQNSLSVTNGSGCDQVVATITFTAPGATSIKINLGDGFAHTNLSSTTFSHVYNTAGNKTIQLIVDNTDTTEFSDFIHVYESPQANFTQSTKVACSNEEVFYSDSTIIGSGEIVEWEWVFSNGVLDSVENPIHLYKDLTGNFPIKLSVIDENGCSDFIEVDDNILIQEIPEALFSSEARIDENNIFVPFIDYVNESIDAESIHWDFDDPASGELNTSNKDYLEHKFSKEGIYEIELIATNELGCTDTIVQTDSLRLKFKFVNLFTPNGDGINDVFEIIEYGDLLAPLQLFVFNRWGQTVFKSGEYYENNWDGIDMNGNLVSAGTYYYLLNYAGITTWTGWVFINSSTGAE